MKNSKEETPRRLMIKMTKRFFHWLTGIIQDASPLEIRKNGSSAIIVTIFNQSLFPDNEGIDQNYHCFNPTNYFYIQYLVRSKPMAFNNKFVKVSQQ